MSLRNFRLDAREWLDENCPAGVRSQMPEEEIVNGGGKQRSVNPDSYVWLERMASRGWTVPHWPSEYGGADLSSQEVQHSSSTVRQSRRPNICRRSQVERFDGARATLSLARVRISPVCKWVRLKLVINTSSTGKKPGRL
jgi:hypothetical protein